MGNLHFTASIDAAQFNKTLDEIEKRIKGIQDNTDGGNPFFNVSNLADGYAVIQSIGELASGIIKVRTEFQQIETTFAALLKNKAAANVLMQEVIKMSAETPFDLKDIADGTTQLLTLGASGKTAAEDLKLLGDVAAGTATPINELATAYGALRQKGEASDEELQQFASKGIPVYEELAKILNTNVENVKYFAQAGKVSFSEVEQAFKAMNSQGGIFNGLMAQQASTLQGSMAQLSNAFSNMFNGIVQDHERLIGGAISTTTDLVNHYEIVFNTLETLVVAYGAYKAAIVTTTALQALSVAAGNIGAWLSLAKYIRTAADAQVWFNLVSNANPYALVASAIALVTLAVFHYTENLTAAEIAQRNLNDAEEQAKKQREELAKTTNDLTATIRSETATRFQQMEAFQQLKALYPALYKEMDIDTFKKQDAIQTQKELNKVLDELSVAEAEEQYRRAIAKVQELDEKIKKLKANADDSNLGDLVGSLKDLEAAKKELEALNEKVKQQKELYYEANTPLAEQVAHYQQIKSQLEASKKKLEETLPPFVSIKKESNIIQDLLKQMSLQGLLSDLNAANTKMALLKGKMKQEDFDFSVGLAKATDQKDGKGLMDLEKLALTENQVNALAQAVKNVKADINQSSPEFKKLQAFYNRLTASNKSTTKAAPAGSIEYWNTISKKAGELLQRINPLAKDGQKEIDRLQQQKIEADKKAEEVAKIINIQSFEETLEEKKNQYQLYQQWIILKGKESADKEFSELKNSGKTYSDYLQAQILALEEKAGSGNISTKDKENLVKLKGESLRIFKEEIEEKKTQYELYNKWVEYYGKETADKQFEDLRQSGTNYKAYLQTQIAALEAKIKDGKATTEDKNNLITLKANIDVSDEGLEKFKKRITDVKENAKSLTEYLEALEKENENLKLTGNKDRIAFVNEQIIETEKKRKALLVDFLNEFNLQEQKRLEIQRKYSDMRAQLDAQYADKKTQVYLNALNKIIGQEKDALQKYDVAAILKNSKGYQELQKIIIGSEDTILRARIESTKKVLDDLAKKGLQNTEEYKKQLQSLIDLQEKLVNNQIGFFSKVGSIFGQLSKESGGVLSVIGDIGRGISGVAANSGRLVELGKIISTTKAAVESASTDQEKAEALAVGNQKKQIAQAMTAAEMAVQAINDMTAVLKNKKDKEKAYYDLVINQQLSYNKLLNDEIRLKAQSESFFTADTASVLTDSIAARTDALKNFNQSLSALLDSGKAKDGTETGVNVTKALGAFLYNPIKAFSATETRDKLTPILEKYPDLYNKAVGGVKGFNKALAQSLIASNALDDATKEQLQTTLDWVEQYEKAQEQLKQSIISLTGQIGENLRDALVNAFREGQTAAEAFGKTVEKVMENILIQALYTKLLKPVIDQLGNEFEASYATDSNGNLIGDGNLIDDIERFTVYGPKAAEEYWNGIAAAQKSFEDKGFDLFKPDTTGSSGGGGMSGAIKGITEATAGVLEGQINAIRISQASNLEVNRSQLMALSKIANNSEYLQYLELLKSIDKKLTAKNDLRAIGVDG